MQAETIINRYQTVQLTTSTPGETLIALYDGLFRYLLVARHGISDTRNRVRTSEAMSRAHAIVSELLLALDHKQAPELCQNLTNVYDFCLQRLLHANIRRDAAALDEVMRVLTPLREAFTIAVKQVAAEKSAQQGSLSP